MSQDAPSGLKSVLSHEDLQSYQEEMVIGVFRPPQGFGMRIHKSRKLPGFKIDKIEKGSYAERIGLQDGDLIIGVDNQPVAGWKHAQFVAAITNELVNTITIRAATSSQAPVSSNALAPPTGGRERPMSTILADLTETEI